MSDRLTDAELDELERKAKAATPGPWATHPVLAQIDAFAAGLPLPVCQMLWPTEQRSEVETEANSEFIVASRNTIQRLISEIRERRMIAAAGKEQE